jgi:DNA polymerase III delta' subunit
MNSKIFEPQDIIGHSKISIPLNRALEQDRFPHALLFAGPSGLGKKLLARSFAARLISQSKSPKEKARSITRIEHGTHQDLIFVDRAWGVKKPTAKIKIEVIRLLEARINLGPYESNSLVIIIDPADTMTPGAANALLKTLEEPPPGIFFFLIAESPDRLPQTIRSRCQIYRFSPLSEDHLTTIISACNIHPSPQELSAVISLCGGSVGKAIDYLESDFFRDIVQNVDKFIGYALNGKLDQILNLTEFLGHMDGEKMIHFFSLLEMSVLSVITTRLHQSREVRNFDAKGWVDSVTIGKRDLAMNVNKQLLLEHLLWKMRKL